VREDDLFLIAGHTFPVRLDNTQRDKAAKTVNGTSLFFSKLYLSHYMKIGKRLEDVPRAEAFRLPIGDDSDAAYSCGADYRLPSENDLGEDLNLLQRTSYPGFDYPKIMFNNKGTANQWQVVRAFGWARHIEPAAGPVADEGQPHLPKKNAFSNGEVWTLLGDVTVDKGLPIHAISDGLVVFSGEGYRKTLVLAHRIPAGPIVSTYSYFGHKSPCPVGTVVRRGNVVAKAFGAAIFGPSLHFAVGKGSILRFAAETGEIKVPANWHMEWEEDAVYEKYYDPTNFLLSITGKYEWYFDVDGNLEGWMVKGDEGGERRDSAQVKDGLLTLASKGFEMESYPLNVEAKRFDSVFTSMRRCASSSHGRVYFATDKEPGYSEDKTAEFVLRNDGQFHEYRAFMGDNPKWKEVIVGIRLTFPDAPIEEATETALDYIRLGRAYLSRIPDTGQTKCYDNEQETTCAAPQESFFGQDAHYTIHTPSFEIKSVDGHEIVTDHVTVLTWQRQHDGIERTWREAVAHCEGLVLGGYADWRLPTKKELQSLLNFGFFRPAIDTAFFPYSQTPNDGFWSATTQVHLSVSAWTVSFWEGQATITDESDLNYVRAVRGRPLEFGHFVDNRDGTVTDTTSGLMWQQGETKAMSWEETLAYCEDMDLGGHQDWRLPAIRELLSLVDDKAGTPSINTSFFPGCRPRTYWSSTTHTGFPDFAWGVPFEGGWSFGASHKGRLNYVRAVRGGREKH
jgi:murein DD-endopeptidase MepM/ murein hydrolase activator NlpD